MTSKDGDKPKPRNTYLGPLLAGAAAGISVDIALYPLDTLKTRLQSEQGFYKTGGFKGIYRGMSAVAATSMPTSAVFFVSYEWCKALLLPSAPAQLAPLVHMCAASVGEVFACVIRNPTEIAKQRKQTYVGQKRKTNLGILFDAYKAEGFRHGVYRGFLSTVLRDLPFSFIQLPVWELLKTTVTRHNDGQISNLQSAMCGALASGFAAGVTTPLDLAKTRIMLAEGYPDSRRLRIGPVLSSIYGETGVRGLFVGAAPRTVAFMIGGFVFFGIYDAFKGAIDQRMGHS